MDYNKTEDTPTSPPREKQAQNNGRNGGDTPSDGGSIISTTGKIPPPKDLPTDAHVERSGDVGGGGDAFRITIQAAFLALFGMKNEDSYLLG